MTTEEREERHQKALVKEFGLRMEDLGPIFNFEKKNPHLWNVTSNPKPLWADNPSLKGKKKSAASSSSRRGSFGKLPLSIGNGANIDENSPCKALGVRVKKTFHDEDTGKPRLFYGIVTAHIAKHRLYKVSYEDGDEEEVTPTELEEILAIKFNDDAVRGDGGGGGTKKTKKKRKRAKARKTHSVLEIV